MIWWLLVPDRAKAHYAPDGLHDVLVANLKHRRHPVMGLNSRGHKIVDNGGMDLGGAMLIDVQNWMTFDIDGLTFSFRASEVEAFLIQLQKLPVRSELGLSYYKLHGAYQCLCLLPEQRDRLIADMLAKLVEANIIREQECAEWDKRLKKLSKPVISIVLREEGEKGTRQ